MGTLMTLKAEIESDIARLLKSAQQRDSNQGQLICSKTLAALAKSQSDSAMSSALEKFNHAYLGIEAHGYLTSSEFAIVAKLRKLSKFPT
jgi:hypothetical protein